VWIRGPIDGVFYLEEAMHHAHGPTRWWRLKYRFAGKEKRLSLGVYPETRLKNARARCDEARKLLGDGVDPSQQRKVDRLVRVERSEETFEKIGRE
jgi:hypothetical protein